MNLQIVAVQHVPEIRVGTNLSECLREAVHRSGWNLQPRDILAVTQKAVSRRKAGLPVSATSFRPPTVFRLPGACRKILALSRLSFGSRAALFASGAKC